MEAAQNPVKRKSKLPSKVWLWVAGGLAVVLLILLVVVLATDCFGLYGPLTKVALGAKKLADAESVTARFAVDASGDTQIAGTLRCCWDLEDRDIKAELQFQLNDKALYYGLVDNCIVWRNSFGKAKSVDVSEELNAFFDSMESESDLDASLKELLESVFKTAGIEEMVDAEEAVTCLKESIFQWNRSDWLQDHAGYDLGKRDDATVYCFKPETGKLLHAVMQHFESAFHKHSDYLDVISGLRELKPQLNEDYKLELMFGLKNGVLSQVDADVDWKGTAVSARILFEDVGTTRVDTEALRQLKEEANK